MNKHNKSTRREEGVQIDRKDALLQKCRFLVSHDAPLSVGILRSAALGVSIAEDFVRVCA